MGRILFGILVVLHGLVHLLYWGQSARYFELQPGLAWPDGSWAFSRLLGEETTRQLVGILLVLTAVGFVTGGAGLFARQAWWRAVLIGVAACSTAVYLLAWDGSVQNLPDKGAVGIGINAAIVAATLAFRWSL